MSEELTTDDQFPYWATQEKCAVQIVSPRQSIMGNWILCRNKDGAEWFIPFHELKAEPERTP